MAFLRGCVKSGQHSESQPFLPVRIILHNFPLNPSSFQLWPVFQSHSHWSLCSKRYVLRSQQQDEGNRTARIVCPHFQNSSLDEWTHHQCRRLWHSRFCQRVRMPLERQTFARRSRHSKHRASKTFDWSSASNAPCVRPVTGPYVRSRSPRMPELSASRVESPVIRSEEHTSELQSR